VTTPSIEVAAAKPDTLPVPVRYKLAALWTSTMFCFVYGDYFELYVPGKLEDMIDGQMAVGPVTQGLLDGTAVVMVIPSLMIALSVLLPAVVCRFLNVGAGLLYAVIMSIILLGRPWVFYSLFAVTEIILTLAVAWHAWRWRQQHNEADNDRTRPSHDAKT
jgi:hypothetical protein